MRAKGLAGIMFVVACVLLTVACQSGGTPADRGVPTNRCSTPKMLRGLSHQEIYKRLLDDWYSHVLAIMDEPARIYSGPEAKGQIFRLLVLPSFERPFCVCLRVFDGGSAEIRLKATDLKNGHRPGKLVVDEIQRVPKGQVDVFLTGLRRADFWNMPIIDVRDFSILDGSQWILEGIKDGRYHVVDRVEPGGDYRKALILLRELSGLKGKPLRPLSEAFEAVFVGFADRAFQGRLGAGAEVAADQAAPDGNAGAGKCVAAAAA